MAPRSRTRAPLDLCHLCHKADAVTRETSAAAHDMDMSVTVVVPFRLCGRCLIKLSDAALKAVGEKYAELRGRSM